MFCHINQEALFYSIHFPVCYKIFKNHNKSQCQHCCIFSKTIMTRSKLCSVVITNPNVGQYCLSTNTTHTKSVKLNSLELQHLALACYKFGAPGIKRTEIIQLPFLQLVNWSVLTYQTRDPIAQPSKARPSLSDQDPTQPNRVPAEQRQYFHQDGNKAKRSCLTLLSSNNDITLSKMRKEEGCALKKYYRYRNQH